MVGGESRRIGVVCCPLLQFNSGDALIFYILWHKKPTTIASRFKHSFQLFLIKLDMKALRRARFLLASIFTYNNLWYQLWYGIAPGVTDYKLNNSSRISSSRWPRTHFVYRSEIRNKLSSNAYFTSAPNSCNANKYISHLCDDYFHPVHIYRPSME